MREAFRERLLSVLERKDHWAWPWFAEGRVPLPRLLPHFQQEWEVYVRDFPVLVARVLGHGPPLRVRAQLAENLYEEQTGGLSGSASHPELFLRMMEGSGYARGQFEAVRLLPAAAAYRALLDETSWGRTQPWPIGAAVLTLFVEGSAHERADLAALQRPPPPPEQAAQELEARIRRHPLVRVHGVDPAALELPRVHHRVEGGHRRDAWETVLENVPPALEDTVVATLEEALGRWLAYRDEVAAACGIKTIESKPKG